MEEIQTPPLTPDQGQQEQQVQEEQQHTNCMFCRATNPVEQAHLRTTLLCGHSCHTYCLLTTPYLDFCADPTCLANIYRIRYDRAQRYNHDDDISKQTKERLTDLLQTDEGFQKDILHLKTIKKSISATYTAFIKEKNRIKREFKQMCLPHVHAIRAAKKLKMAEVKRLDSYKQFKSKCASVSKKISTMRRKYTFNTYDLYSLRNYRIKGKSLGFLFYARNGFLPRRRRRQFSIGSGFYIRI